MLKHCLHSLIKLQHAFNAYSFCCLLQGFDLRLNDAVPNFWNDNVETRTVVNFVSASNFHVKIEVALFKSFMGLDLEQLLVKLLLVFLTKGSERVTFQIFLFRNFD